MFNTEMICLYAVIVMVIALFILQVNIKKIRTKALEDILRVNNRKGRRIESKCNGKRKD